MNISDKIHENSFYHKLPKLHFTIHESMFQPPHLDFLLGVTFAS